MCEKIGKSGLCYQHFQLAFKRNSENGIQALFSKKLNARVDMMKCKEMIFPVPHHFKG